MSRVHTFYVHPNDIMDRFFHKFRELYAFIPASRFEELLEEFKPILEKYRQYIPEHERNNIWTMTESEEEDENEEVKVH